MTVNGVDPSESLITTTTNVITGPVVTRWPGVFIPGDEAIATADMLEAIAARLDDDAVRAAAPKFLKRLAARLAACRVRAA